LRILFLNWRDIRHPKHGGAEVYNHEVCRRLVAQGHSVELFTASFPGAAPSEEIDGVRIIRAGRQGTVHLRAFYRYRVRARRDFDVVIEEINTLPFWTPRWAGVPTVLVIHQLAREVWRYEAPPPVSIFGYFAERYYLRPYRHVPVVTLGESTRQDLRELGFRGPIRLLPPGVSWPPGLESSAPLVPTFVYLGRMAPSKRVDEIIQAFAIVRKRLGRGRLRLMGHGAEAYTRRLHTLSESLGVPGDVEFLGRVDDATKFEALAASSAIVMASVREGWGIAVTEAGAVGTPSIVYNVPGLRDSTRDGESGLVVDPNPDAMAAAMCRLVEEKGLRDRLARCAIDVCRKQSYDDVCAGFQRVLNGATGR
jgi:glycosyltransferase involved in cell wall biosynthesis